ncbi:MAG: hypothetical protein K9J37_01145 [Saprospiraceae bacterium]|nr:hypothetical protein [Saprospiraceae bacterium]MCF8248482.1 hypothetical protein [Saprospiraceae bacterium]MCF8281815.1 hypothetical protein [Bacteroidales bacterium]MCF8310216.1 hypothetical protein [Saprospiraceae bacterium]MCF8439345.1 hypothetical protein [Saprospiraceae bacterium]
MKKLSSYFFAAIFAAFFTACAGDVSEGVGSSCSMEGNWKVRSADVTSEKLDKSVLEISKESMLKTTYSFTADNVSINSGGYGGVFQGKYVLDAATNTLSWNTISPTTESVFNDNMKVVSCGSNEITLLKRSPVDTTQVAFSKATLVLERVQ